ncbi:MAG: hypothetical protein M0Q93_10620 [Terrimicrobiaceae bacterium]|nr:hypothetical protein [Terrimicrobiaceae bacterium]
MREDPTVCELLGIEAARGRRWGLLIAARLVQSGRQRVLQICATGGWWDQLKEGYTRLCRWLEATAPQLGKPPDGIPDFSPLKPQSLCFNCRN